MSRLRIGVLSAADATNPNIWSGTTYHSVQALQAYCGDIVHLGPYPGNPWLYEFAKNRVSRLFTGKGTNFHNSYRLARKFSSFFSKRLKEVQCDILYAPAAAAEVSLLETSIPIIGLSDSNYVLISHYDEYKNHQQSSQMEFVHIEQLFMEKCALLAYPTEWVAHSTIHDCGINPKKVCVAPFGANLKEEDIPDASLAIRMKKSEKCTLLFLGVDWVRKGGALAFDTLQSLKKMGISAELIVCGCIPPNKFRNEDMKVIPFLDKRKPTEKNELRRLLLESDFLLLPTRAESYGIVFCEASAFGIPSITTDVGGVSGVVHNGKNGYTLPYSATGHDYAHMIAEIWSDEKRYCELSLTSRSEFDMRLNWKTWAHTMSDKCNEIVR